MKLRSEIEAQYKWDTTHIFKSIEDFEKEANTAAKLVEMIPSFAGKLGDVTSAKEALDIVYACSRQIMALASFADRNRDVDMSVSQFQSLSGLVETLQTKFVTAAAYMDPELIKLPKKTLAEYKANPDFDDYSRYFDEIIRNKPHTLKKEEEKIIAQFSAIANGQYEAYSTFTSADMPSKKAKLSNGEEVEIDLPNYMVLRYSDNSDDRKAVFDTFWGNYDKYKNTITKMLNYQLKYITTASRVRKFDSALDRAMHANELPKDFYSSLIANIRGILPALHSYLALKKDVLKLDKPGYQDIYAHLVKAENKKTYSYEESVALVNKAMSPMTDEYREVLEKAMLPGSGWVDVYPNQNKRGGAYMSGEAYDTHPFVLLNHTDDYNSVSTLAHEMGHAMHSHFSNKYQPFAKSQYSIFVAEVASIFNEIMLINHLIKNAQDKSEKIFLLNHYIEMIRGTVFRQMQFAEFEDILYKKSEAGEALTPDFNNEKYLQLLKEYYGEDKGLITIDPLYAVEWAFVPHFFYNYYVYQYVVGFIGALSFATKLLNGKLSADQYINGFLKAGSSKSPVEILKEAGVDMNSKEPYQLTAEVFNSLLEELRSLIK